MATISQHPDAVIGGVDTHKDTHVAAALDGLGRLLGTESFPTTRRGYQRLLAWLQSHGDLTAVGVEGCGSWGAGLARHLRGKSDIIDAENAARAVLAGKAKATPKSATGPVEAIRQLRVARAGAMKARTAAANQIHSLCDTAPETIRAKLRGLSIPKRVAVAERWRPGSSATPEAAAKRAIASVSCRWRALDAEARTLRKHLKTILDEIAPELLAVHAVGYDTASQLLITAGDNPERLGSERSFASLCSVSPVPASTGRTTGRYRLNRGGDRHANSALWRIVIVRMGTHQPTKDYVARRTAEGMPRLEIIRCLKRYVARQLYPLITAVATDHLAPPETIKTAA